MPTRTKTEKRSGFSLVEIVMAVGIAASTLIVLLALMGSTVRQSREALDAQVLINVSEAVSNHLRGRPFAEVYHKLQADYELVACTWSANPDGSPEPVDRTGQPGVDYLLVTTIAQRDDPSFPDRVKASTDPLILIKLSPSLSNGPDSVTPFSLPANPTDFVGGALIIEAKLYLLPSLSLPLPPNAKPVQTIQLAINR